MMRNEITYYNLTHPQKRIWYLDRVNSDATLNNIGGCLKIKGRIDIKTLEETLNILIQKNEGFRLRFSEIDGEPVQYIYNFEKHEFKYIDFSVSHMSDKEEKKCLAELFRRKIELKNCQLYNFTIYKSSNGEYGILLSIHHIISDGWSISLIGKQVCEIYDQLKGNKGINLDHCNSYIEYIQMESEYISSSRLMKNKEFWNNRFENMPEEFLYNTTLYLEGNRKTYYLERELSDKIKNFAKQNQFSLNTVFTALQLIYINKTTGKTDLVIGIPIYNRVNVKQKRMIGVFTNTVPFRFNLDTELTMEELVKQIDLELKLCFVNQKYPYDLLVKDLLLSKTGYDSLFKMSINYYNSEFLDKIDGYDVEIEEYYCGNQSYSLQVIVKEEKDNCINLKYDYKINDYSQQEIQRMHDLSIHILESFFINENMKVKDVKLLKEEEINYKLYTLNSTHSIYPKNTVTELFEEQVKKKPDRVALEFRNEILTYRELNEKANLLAHYLKTDGITEESIVGILMDHSMELVVSILAVLKAGGAYLPIDCDYPEERIKYMLQDSETFMLLTDRKVEKGFNFTGKIVNVKQLDLISYDKENLMYSNSLFHNLSYIIYTSGSTGKPKGVMIDHQGLTNYIVWANKMYLKDENEVMALYSSIAFDLTVTSIFTPLISGNKIVIYDTDESEFVLYKILRENKVTVLKLTPAHLTLIKDRDNSNSIIKRFIVGGEALKVSLARDITNSFHKKIEIYNEYGPTETVVGCMIYQYDEEKDIGLSVPIGGPADNVQIYLLDHELNVVPTGHVGELYISGDGVARGYRNKEDLTKERFTENPFIKKTRMYRTGDTARYLENGVIEYIGRVDNQVKNNGYRIELGEIERSLMGNPSVKNAVADIKETSTGKKILTAYIVCEEEIPDKELKNWLSKFLPKYMIPTNFIYLNNIPLTVNGKVDYNRLPITEVEKKEYIKYTTEVEREVIRVIEDVLNVKEISMNDNYYKLGGDSIKSIQISSKLKNIGLNLKTKDILTSNSIGEIAATVEASNDRENLNQEQSEGYIENTPIILWFFEQEFSNNNHYNQYILLEFDTSLDIDKISRAYNELIRHHEMLRANYDKESKSLYYNKNHINQNYAVDLIDFSNISSQEHRSEIYKKIKGYKTDIETSLLFNITVFQLDNEKQALLFTAHHLIVDGVSWRIILEDFFDIVKQLENNKRIVLPRNTTSYKEWSNYLHQINKDNYMEERQYWNLILDKDFIYPVDFNEGIDIIRNSSTIKKELAAAITSDFVKKINEIYSIDLNEVLIIAIALTMNKLTDKNEIVIELEQHGRSNVEASIDLSRTIGWFTSIYPAGLNVSHTGLEDNIKSLKDQIRAIPNKGFYFGVLKYLNNELKDRKNKHIRFNYLGDFESVLNMFGSNVRNAEFGLDSTEDNKLTVLMDINVILLKKKLNISITYSNNQFKSETIHNFISTYEETFMQIMNNCLSKNQREITPSDFVAEGISQRDLDMLFD